VKEAVLRPGLVRPVGPERWAAVADSFSTGRRAARGLAYTMRLDLSGPRSRKRLAFSSQAV
jgi:hypothetical protein